VSITGLLVCQAEGTYAVVQQIAKRDISYGDPDLVTDQGNRFKLNFGSTEGHPNACPGHYICCKPRQKKSRCQFTEF
jgi:hypothetical protein